MSAEEGLEQLVSHLNKIREHHGDEVWRSSCLDVARTLLAQGGVAEKFARKAFEGIVDFETLGREGSEVSVPGRDPAQEGMLKALQSQVPSMRTQAQFNAFMVTLDAARALLDAVFAGDSAREAQARDAFEKAVEVARKVTEISNQLRDVPEAATSAAAAEFKEPPKQFGEYDVQRSLLAELHRIVSVADLTEWYDRNRSRMGQVASQSLRNALFDAIRDKKASLQGAESP